jgi:hypothetical protein
MRCHAAHERLHVNLSEHAGHLLVQILKVVLAHAGLGQQLVQGRHTLLLRAGDAHTHRVRAAFVDPCHEYHGHVFMANAAFHHRTSTPIATARLAGGFLLSPV